MNSDDLMSALRQLRAATPANAPERVERRLLVEFRRRQQSMRRRRAGWALAGSVAAAAGIAALFLAPQDPGPLEVRLQHAGPAPLGLLREAESVRPAVAVVVARRRPPRTPRVSTPPESITPAPAEVATEFLALPNADMLPPVNETSVVRVEMPRSAMRLVGLPVNENRVTERVRADVVFGQDGMARAIRFVQ